MPGARHRHRHGQVRHHLPQDRRDAGQHRHVGVFSPSGGSDARRSWRHPAQRSAAGDFAQRRDAGSAASARGHPPHRREDRRHHRQSRVDARTGGRRRARLPGVRRSVSTQPRAHGKHHRGARDGRRALHDAARRKGIPRRGLRQDSSRRQAGQEADARRPVDARRRRCADRQHRHADARRHLRDFEEGARHDVRGQRARRAGRHHHGRRPAPLPARQCPPRRHERPATS